MSGEEAIKVKILEDFRMDIELLYPSFTLWYEKRYGQLKATQDEIRRWYDFIAWLLR